MPEQSFQATVNSTEGDAHINDLDFILGEEPEGDAPVEEVADSADSGETPAEPQEDQSAEGVEATGGEDRAAALAKEHGLNPANPRDKKLLDILILQEKRLADKDGYIDNLKQAAQLDLTTDFDRQLSEPPAQQQQQPFQPQQNQQQAPYIPQRPLDIGDREGWQSFDDAARSAFTAMQEGDHRKFTEVQNAWMNRLIANVLPQIGQGIEMRLSEFKKTDPELGAVTKTVQRQQQEEIKTRARESAVSALRKIPEVNAIWDEMYKIDTNAKPIVVDGKEFAPSPINRILAERPEIMDINITRHPKTGQFLTEEQAERATTEAQYKAVIKEYFRQKQTQQAAPKQAVALVKAGQEMAKREAGQERARQSLNAGGRQRAGGPQSSDDQWMEGLTRGNHTTVGQSARTLFKT